MKKIIVCYFASVGSLATCVTALNTNLIPLAVIMAAAFTGCLLWFCDITRQWNARRRRADRTSKPREIYSIDIPLDDDPEDKPVGSVRPGSRPSAAYEQMKAMQESAS